MIDTLPCHVTALLAAIDAGDDIALPFLADALEEIGDPLAAGLSEIIQRGLCPDTIPLFGRDRTPIGHGWMHSFGACYCVGGEAWDALARLNDGRARPWFDWLLWDTRSAAYLALAAALTQED